jgi:hypothetical protein
MDEGGALGAVGEVHVRRDGVAVGFIAGCDRDTRVMLTPSADM